MPLRYVISGFEGFGVFLIFIWHFQGKISFTHTQISIVPSFFGNQRTFHKKLHMLHLVLLFHRGVYLSLLRATSLQQNTFFSWIYFHLLARLELQVFWPYVDIFSPCMNIFCRHYFCVSAVIWVCPSNSKKNPGVLIQLYPYAKQHVILQQLTACIVS